MGVAAGDIDNDGCVDLYLTRFGRNQMFRNNGDGTFTDVSPRAGTDDPRLGRLRGVRRLRPRRVARSVRRQLPELQRSRPHIRCFGDSGQPDYCAPERYRAAAETGSIATAATARSPTSTREAGMARDFGPALGVSTADFNGDGWIDIFVANDQQENQLWINQRNGTFENTALLSGVALNGAGDAKANMGVDAGDFDNDGDEDLFITDLTGEGSTLYVNDGTGHVRRPERARSGIGSPACRTPASAPPGSTSTTTAGWTC